MLYTSQNKRNHPMEFMTVDQINEKLIFLTRNERKLTHEILNHIILFQKVGALFKRSRGCCEFIGKDNVRCQSRYKLQIDHFEIHFSQGGANSIENCKLLCSNHNLHGASLAGIGFEMTLKFPSSSSEHSPRG